MSAISSSALSNFTPMTSSAERGPMSSMNGSSMLKALSSAATGGVQKSKSDPQTDPTDPARVAEDFEGVFASLLLKEMRKTLEPGTMFGEDSGDVYGGMFDMYLGQQMSQSGGFGMAKMVRESMARSQSAINAGPTTNVQM
jgi:peptidoglycan hydrolase FlgJ